MPSLAITADTILKPDWRPSSAIRESSPSALLLPVKKGLRLDCKEILWHEGEQIIKDETDGDDHFYIDLAKPLKRTNQTRWFVWGNHGALLEDTHPALKETSKPGPSAERIAAAAKIIKSTSSRAMNEDPKKSKQKAIDLGPAYNIPGFSRPRHAYEPICFIGKRPAAFCWGEATKDGQRIPVNAQITVAIRKSCEYLMIGREVIGRMQINSWYRDPATNRRVKGARSSKHLGGGAVDFFPLDAPFNLATWRQVCKTYPSGGLAAGSGFFHLDLRPFYAFWNYPGAPGWSTTRY